jgi:lipopolysaccharide/colanic/teichoic acid biosynthesis glycosyltransferase
MNAAWVGLCGSALLLAVWLLRDALTDMCKEEVRTRLTELPYTILHIVALRIPRPERNDVLTEWRAELDFILSETDGLPITRLLRGVRYSLGMLGLMLPFTDARHVMAAHWWKMVRQRTTVRPTAGPNQLQVDHPQLSGHRQLAKNMFDRSVALLGLLVLSPLLLAIAISIKLSDNGPALFTQTRVGKGGKPFTMYKFRTMVVDAEARLSEIQEKRASGGVPSNLVRGPRITTIGAHLRRWSLDELPQLINVLSGDMSLVGPRPALPEESAMHPDHVRRRLIVKPGLTGMWEVTGRPCLSWDESLRLDLRYVENWSFALDLQILWKTGSVLFHAPGAY